MQKRAPTLGNLLVIVLFVLSCFGLLMFLWESFGGPLPLKPKGYRFSIAFPRSFALAEESDVRISGVEVGHVVSLDPDSEGATHATVEIAGRYAPIRANMHAILRQKTLLGETYVQLIPEGSSGTVPARRRTAPREPGGTVGDARRHPFRVQCEDQSATSRSGRRSVAEGIDGRGEGINASFAQLEPFVESANKLVTLLDEQEGAVRALVHNTGVVFNALASRDHQLEGSIVNGERTFHAAAEASDALAAAFRVLPSFEHNSTVALKETDKFAADRQPVLRRIPGHRAPARGAAQRRQAVHARIQRLPNEARSPDSLGQDRSAGHGQGPQTHGPDPRKLQAGAAQPRSVPAVPR